MPKSHFALTTRTLHRTVNSLCREDCELRRAVGRSGTPPLWSRAPGFATLVKIILEQQVSLASARHAYHRLQTAAGRVTAPAVRNLGFAGMKKAGLTRQKSAYCFDLASRVCDGRLVLRTLPSQDDETVRSRLTSVLGIGRWTTDIFLLMGLLRPDVWPVGDLALAKSMQQVKGMAEIPDLSEQKRIASAWTPYRSVAARILWHHYLFTLRTSRRTHASNLAARVPQRSSCDTPE